MPEEGTDSVDLEASGSCEPLNIDAGIWIGSFVDHVHHFNTWNLSITIILSFPLTCICYCTVICNLYVILEKLSKRASIAHAEQLTTILCCPRVMRFFAISLFPDKCLSHCAVSETKNIQLKTILDNFYIQLHTKTHTHKSNNNLLRPWILQSRAI